MNVNKYDYYNNSVVKYHILIQNLNDSGGGRREGRGRERERKRIGGGGCSYTTLEFYSLQKIPTISSW